jgi:arginyl-tRNA synthetase
MDLFFKVRQYVLNELDTMAAAGELPSNLETTGITVEPPRDPLHGDMATNAAMVLAKAAKNNPREIAEKLAKRLACLDIVDSTEVAGPGFLNLRINVKVWQSIFSKVLELGNSYGRTGLGNNLRVNVEFVSANPTGPLHVGHTRGAVFGDALSRLLSFAGYDVTREYYINDGGSQVDTLARSVYLRYLEAHGKDVAFEDGTYPGDYLIPVGQALKDKVGSDYIDKAEHYWLDDVRQFATDAMMSLIKEDLASLGIEMDNFFSEKSLYGVGKIEEAIENLKSKNLIYEGVLDPPKGKKVEDWEPRVQTLFKSTLHGDDVDRPIKKSDGAWTYFAPDIAYHFDKVDRKFDQLIDVFGADHGGYVKRMKAAVSALSNDEVKFDIKLTQLVKLFKNGEPFKMSKRAGTFVTLRDLVDQVGSDVTRFVMLTRKNDAPLDFDFDKVLEQSRDNPVYYVQYASARIHSVFRKADEAGIAFDKKQARNERFETVNHESEIKIAKKLAEWPRLVEIAAKTNEPHRIAFYLYDLAGDFHSLWNKGNEISELRFIQEEHHRESCIKMAMISAVLVVISSGLDILGVEPATHMN